MDCLQRGAERLERLLVGCVDRGFVGNGVGVCLDQRLAECVPLRRGGIECRAGCRVLLEIAWRCSWCRRWSGGAPRQRESRGGHRDTSHLGTGHDLPPGGTLGQEASRTSLVEDGHLDAAQPFGVGDQLHLEDPIASDRQDANTEEPPAGRHHDTHGSVDERELHEAHPG